MTPSRDAVICEPVRTPIGSYGGSLRDVSATALGVTALTALLERTGVDGQDVDDVILGHCYPNSEAPAIGRVVALDAGLPVSVPGYQVDRRCGSGLQAIINAALCVASGAMDSVIAGGVESMSNVAFYSTELRWGTRRDSLALHDGLARGRVTAGGVHHPVPGGMLETAENLRRRYEISRAEQDELALESHRRAVAAQQSGVFGEEIVPIKVTAGRETRLVDIDEHPRPSANLEKLASLRPVLSGSDPEATVTAGNASGQNDAASMCLVTTREKADRYGLRPLARITAWAVAGVSPEVMGLGPVAASERALAAAGLSLTDMDVIEMNEAFAAQALAVYREWGFGATDLERTNIHGSGISLGHPVGATGGRMVGALTRELVRRGGHHGLVTMCIGGGQGLAAVFERIADA